MSRLIYLREANEFVGPFASRGDAERFLTLMKLSGESLEGIETVEIDGHSTPNAISVEERRQLLGKAKRPPRSPHGSCSP